MMAHLLDTDIVIDFLKGRPGVVELVRELADEGLAVSVITVAELCEGVYGSDDEEEHLAGAVDFLTGVHVLTIDDETARTFGRLRAHLRKQGRLIDNFDLLIAATCLRHDLVLHTGNTRHFERIERTQLVPPP